MLNHSDNNCYGQYQGKRVNSVVPDRGLKQLGKTIGLKGPDTKRNGKEQIGQFRFPHPQKHYTESFIKGSIARFVLIIE